MSMRRKGSATIRLATPMAKRVAHQDHEGSSAARATTIKLKRNRQMPVPVPLPNAFASLMQG